jgi:NADH-quinone oxidoreductase subunit H
MISYEISIGFTVLSVVVCAGSFNLSTIVIAQQKIWFIVPLLPVFMIFYISMLAVNRHRLIFQKQIISFRLQRRILMTFALF